MVGKDYVMRRKKTARCVNIYGKHIIKSNRTGYIMSEADTEDEAWVLAASKLRKQILDNISINDCSRNKKHKT